MKPTTRHDIKKAKLHRPRPKSTSHPTLALGDTVTDQHGKTHRVGRIEPGRIVFLDGSLADGATWTGEQWKAVIKGEER